MKNPDEMSDLAAAVQAVAEQIKYLGNGNAATQMGAIEAHGKFTSEAIEAHGNLTSEAIRGLASSVDDLAEAIHEVGIKFDVFSDIASQICGAGQEIHHGLTEVANAILGYPSGNC